MDSSKKYDNVNPVLTANIISRLFYVWHRKIYKIGLNRSLEVSDLYNTLKNDLSQPLGDHLEKQWQEELLRARKKDRKPKLLHAIRAVFLGPFMYTGMFIAFQVLVVRTLMPLLLGCLIALFDPARQENRANGYYYAGGLVLCTFMFSLISFHCGQELQLQGMRIRIACCSLVYRKMLKLSSNALGETAAGQVINLISNDVNRFDFLPYYLHYIWLMPLQAVTMSYFMWRSVGLSAYAGIGVIALQAIPLQGILSKYIAKLRYKIAGRTDNRVKLMSEIISGIQVIKMYAWERPFNEVVKLARMLEIRPLLITSYVRGFSIGLMVYTERLSLFFTLVTFVLSGHQLTSEITFSMAQYFNSVQLYMAIFFPMGIIAAGEALVSIRRLEEFLSQEEKTVAIMSKTLDNGSAKPSEVCVNDQANGSIQLTNITASWIKHSIVPTLGAINVDVKPGQLIGVVGAVGSGKSSLFHLILKELEPSKGNVSVNGTVAFASQEPWLFQSSVRNNILFGLEYDRRRYNDTVRACALLKDFEQLPHRDRTVIGDRGSGLSGGQKARINLARAVYRDVDIYLFDDPLSAVDTHVGKHLFEKCMRGYLSKKTRILATHQLHYLKEADVVIVLSNGSIERCGTWDEISKTGELENELKKAASTRSVEKLATLESGEDVLPMVRPRKVSQVSSYASSLMSLDNPLDEPPETQELMEKGALKGSLIVDYMRASGGFCGIFFLLFLLALSQLFSSGNDYWLSYWSKEEEIHRQNRLLNATDDAYVDALPTETSLHIYTALIVGCVAFVTISRLLFFKLCMNASQNLHDLMFGNILHAVMRFFDTNPSGRILNRFSKDMGAIDELLPKCMMETIQIFSVMTGILSMILIVNPYLGVVVIILGYIFFKIRSIYMPTAQDIKRLEGITRSPVFSHVSSTLDGLTTIRACHAQDLLKKEFDTHQDVHTSSWYLFVATSSSFGFWLDLVSITFLAIVTFSFVLLDAGDTLSGNVGLAISQCMILTGMLQYGMRQASEVMSQMTSVERVLQYTKLDKEGPYDSLPGQKPPSTWPQRGALQFNNVYLSYAPDEPAVLNDLNIVVSPGEKIGIVGRTGAGKSSLISALFRLAPIDGDILIDDVSSKKIGLYDLRSKISIIPQTPVLFSASLRHNLDAFNKCTDEQIWSALEQVELKEIATSLDHKISEGGSNLSAGQRQLVCLARALLRNNKVLILDEATANVDPNTDQLIQKTIRDKFSECTVLTIAHRLNTIMDSHKVLVMDAGRIVEFDHAHLLLQNPNGIFTKMVQQTGEKMQHELEQTARNAYKQLTKQRMLSVDSIDLVSD